MGGSLSSPSRLLTGAATALLGCLNALGVPGGALAAGCGSFGGPKLFLAGPEQTAVVTADFNGDGKLDLAVTRYREGLSILQGNGDGTFGAPTTVDAGDAETGLAVGDFNGDGRLDLAVTNGGPGVNSVSILLGGGDGTFGTASSFSTGAEPISVAVGDFNGDSNLDLAVVNYGFGANTVSILLGNGDGTFGAATSFGAGVQPTSVTIADLNGDSRLDLAVANYVGPDSVQEAPLGGVAVLLGTGDGAFGAPTRFDTGGVGSFSVGVADFNGDGKVDLATANSGVNTVSVLLGNGDGSFGAATNFAVGAGPLALAVADLNGDGKPDLAVANHSCGTVSILLGNGDGSFAAATRFSAGTDSFAAFPTSLAIGDFDGDTGLDVAVANFGGIPGTGSVLLNCDTGGVVPPNRQIGRCENRVAKNMARLMGCQAKCHIKQAVSALQGMSFDEEACEEGATHSCRAAYNKASATILARGYCPCCLDAPAQSSIADHATNVLDQINGQVYCAGSSPLGDDDRGFVPPDTEAAVCENTVAKHITRLVRCLAQCQIKQVYAIFAGHSFDAEACAGTSLPMSCRAEYDRATSALLGNGGCPPCLDATAQASLADQMANFLDQNHGPLHCEGTTAFAGLE
jgi:VCBS repeat protein